MCDLSRSSVSRYVLVVSWFELASCLTFWQHEFYYYPFSEMQSAVRQNLHSEVEADVNKLINVKLNASYTYLALVRILHQYSS